jgi:hypothetical protein
MENLAEKILNEKITAKLNDYKKRSEDGYRPFAKECDFFIIDLTPRQFFVIERNFKVKSVYVLCEGRKYDNFTFGEWTIVPHYNDRMAMYELKCVHKDFIEDENERDNFHDRLMDRLMGYIA